MGNRHLTRVALEDGLPEREGAGRHVIIVSAGMAGLTAGLLLREAGHRRWIEGALLSAVKVYAIHMGMRNEIPGEVDHS